MGKEVLERRLGGAPHAVTVHGASVGVALTDRRHECLGLLWRGQHRPAEEVRRHDGEAVASEPVGEGADRPVQAPPRVQQQDGAAGRRAPRCEVAIGFSSRRLDADHLSHALEGTSAHLTHGVRYDRSSIGRPRTCPGSGRSPRM